MIKELETLFELHRDEVLHVAAARYGFDSAGLSKLGSFESYVYEAEPEEVILKITHDARRTEAYVMGEVEFVSYLADHGVPVSAPVPSKRGRLVETLDMGADGIFVLYAFEKAQGHEPCEDELDDDFFEKWGRLTGQIHRLSKAFQPSRHAFQRQQWYEEDVLDFARYVPVTQSRVYEKKQKLFDKLDALPRTRDSYGLAHNDIHYGNIHLDEGHLTIFDFDDCSYQWFINDVAIAVHSVLPGYDQAHRFGEITQHFLAHFMRGYWQENELDASWLASLPDFLMLYDLIIYGVIHQAWDLEHLSERRKKTLHRIKHRIENEICIVETDWRQLPFSI